MKELLDTLTSWQGEGIDAGRAVVVRTFGSAPRPEGAVLLRATDGRIAGSVSGGCVEGAAAEQIEHARSTGKARVIRYGISDEQAWDVGLACGERASINHRCDMVQVAMFVLGLVFDSNLSSAETLLFHLITIVVRF